MARVSATQERRTLPTPYVDLDRRAWSRLRESHPMSLEQSDLARLRGLGERLDLNEVEEVYLPLSRLLHFYVEATHGLRLATSEFLGERPTRVPFVVGVAGSVAVGKSTTARILKELMSRWPQTPRVELVTTDGFLHPNAELERRGLLHRKGFPESYDRRALLRFIAAVKSGMPVVEAPQYSHLTYDVLPETIRVRRPDVLIVEGLNVLQPPTVRPDGTSTGAISDYFDFSVYVDAPVERDPRLVRRALPAAARDGVRPPAVVLPPLRPAQRRGGPRHGARHLGADQRAEPRRERAAHPRPGDPRADQGCRPRRDEHQAAEDLTRPPPGGDAGQYQCGDWLFQKSRALHGEP